MKKSQFSQLRLRTATAMVSSVICGVVAANMTAVAYAQNVMTENLGDPNWVENPEGMFLNTNLIQQDGDVIVFDSFTDSDLYYIRHEGDCDAMTVRELRHGGFESPTVISFVDVSDRPAYKPEGIVYDLLEVACQHRESQATAL